MSGNPQNYTGCRASEHFAVHLGLVRKLSKRVGRNTLTIHGATWYRTSSAVPRKRWNSETGAPGFTPGPDDLRGER